MSPEAKTKIHEAAGAAPTALALVEALDSALERHRIRMALSNDLEGDPGANQQALVTLAERAQAGAEALEALPNGAWALLCLVERIERPSAVHRWTPEAAFRESPASLLGNVARGARKAAEVFARSGGSDTEAASDDRALYLRDRLIEDVLDAYRQESGRAALARQGGRCEGTSSFTSILNAVLDDLGYEALAQNEIARIVDKRGNRHDPFIAWRRLAAHLQRAHQGVEKG